MPPRKKFPSFRRHAEIFTEIFSDPTNRAVHEAKRPELPFSTAEVLDWSDSLKRKDIGHRDDPPRFQALVPFQADVWQAAGGIGDPDVCFVVFYKINHRLKLISIRYATPKEYGLFYDL